MLLFYDADAATTRCRRRYAAAVFRCLIIAERHAADGKHNRYR